MLITTLMIKDLKYEIYFDDPIKLRKPEFLETDCGSTVFSESKIYINSTIPSDLILRTIRHELMHAYLWSYGYANVKFDEEVVCNLMETFAADIIKDADLVFKTYKKKVVKENEL